MVKNDQEGYIKNLVELYEREKDSRCYFQLERDKLIQMREIEKEKFDDLKSKLFEAHEKLAEFEAWHHEEILNLNKKIKYLIGEREIKINDLKLQFETENKVNLNQNLEERSNYLDGVRESLNKLNEDRLNLDEALRNLILTNENKIAQLQNDYSQATSSIQKACETRFNGERDNFFLITRNAIHEITELKNSQIADIKRVKDKSYDELRAYFKELTQNLMSQNQSLNQKNSTFLRILKEFESKLSKAGKELADTIQENVKLKKENKSLNSKSILYLKNTQIFQARKHEFSTLEKNYSDLDIRYEALLLSFVNLKNENERLQNYIQNLIVKFREKFETFNYISMKKQQVILQEFDLSDKTQKNLI